MEDISIAVGVKKYRRQIADRQRKQCGGEANLRTSRDREEFAFPTSSENLVLVAPLTFPHIISTLQNWMPLSCDEWVVDYDQCHRHGVRAGFSIFLAAAAFDVGLPASPELPGAVP